MPSKRMTSGRMRTQVHWNTSVRRKEMAADTPPLFRAVKKEEAKMLKPASRKVKENSRKAWTVRVYRSASVSYTHLTLPTILRV